MTSSLLRTSPASNTAAYPDEAGRVVAAAAAAGFTGYRVQGLGFRV
jgi:hypothetical protein